jgi:hypothetical protein
MAPRPPEIAGGSRGLSRWLAVHHIQTKKAPLRGGAMRDLICMSYLLYRATPAIAMIPAGATFVRGALAPPMIAGRLNFSALPIGWPKSRTAIRLFFERFRDRSYRVRLAAHVEIEQTAALTGKDQTPPRGFSTYAVIQNIGAGERLRLLAVAPVNRECDVDEATARAIFEAFAANADLGDARSYSEPVAQ